MRTSNPRTGTQSTATPATLPLILLSRFIVGSFLFSLSLISTWADSDERGAHALSSKAIEAAEQTQGFRLKIQAAQALGIEFVPVESRDLVAESQGIVQFQDFVAVYRRRAGWIRMVEVEGTRLPDGRLRFYSKEFQSGDEIASRGAPELRVIDMDLWGPKADACGD